HAVVEVGLHPFLRRGGLDGVAELADVQAEFLGEADEDLVLGFLGLASFGLGLVHLDVHVLQCVLLGRGLHRVGSGTGVGVAGQGEVADDEVDAALVVLADLLHDGELGAARLALEVEELDHGDIGSFGTGQVAAVLAHQQFLRCRSRGLRGGAGGGTGAARAAIGVGVDDRAHHEKGAGEQEGESDDGVLGHVASRLRSHGGSTDAAAPEPESENRALGAALCTGASASATTLGACPGEGDAPVVATEASQSEQRKSATTSTSSTRGDHCRRPGADTLAAVCTTLPTLVTSQSRITLRSSCVIRKTGRPGGETHRTVLRLLWVRASGLRPGYGLVERTLSTDAARGTILLTGGGLALEPYPRWVTLAAGKAALRTLAINLHKELLPEGIHIADRRRGGERRRPPSQGSAGRTWMSSAWRTCGRRSQRWSGEQDAPGRHGDRTPPPRPA